MFNDVTFEISGVCNARCYWCQTGFRNGVGVTQQRQAVKDRKGFVDLKEFKEAILFIKKSGFVREHATYYLCNWGEPFLHPDFKEIIKFLGLENIPTGLSTNAGKLVEFDSTYNLKHINAIRFSMCGFSRNSYDKIHKLQFDKVKENITKIIRNFRARGFRGYAEISYHLYQFNLNEIEPAKKFAKKNNLCFNAYAAVINDFERSCKYITSGLGYEELKKAGQELLLNYIEDRIRNKPARYVCPQFNMLTVDEFCNVITCCGDSTVFKKITGVSNAAEINIWRCNSDICKKCLSLGASFAGHNIASVKEVLGAYKFEALLDVLRRGVKLLLSNLKL
jgi:molybdenum cofactor biosynthesis enzyme MoaA